MHIMSHIRPFQGLGFSTKILLSSVAYGDTSFQRKGAPALRHAAPLEMTMGALGVGIEGRKGTIKRQ
jgi:hypothetical protein